MKTGVLGGRVGAGLLLASALASAPALANGRFPAAQLVLTDPTDPNRIWVRGTYGVLTSSDAGCTWHWICESALGYRGTEDPMLGVMAGGTVIAGIFDGLASTHDSGCNWSLEGTLKGLNVVDLSVLKTSPRAAVAITSNGDGNGTFVNKVWRTSNSAGNWTQLGQALAPDLILFTIDAGPTSPTQLYITAARYSERDGGFTNENVLLRSDDDGLTWRTLPIGVAGAADEAYLSALDPNDPRKIYVRLRGNPDAADPLQNRVVYSEDDGQSWRQIFAARADILGFALSPDGSRVALGLGDSRQPGETRFVDRSLRGLYTASTSDHQFVRRREGQVACLKWAEDRMYFCGDSFPEAGTGGFELGFTNDEGATATMLMKLNGIEGPLSCPVDSQTSQVCGMDDTWQRVCEVTSRCDLETGKLVPYERSAICPQSGGAGGGAGQGGQGGGSGNNGGASMNDPDAGGQPGAAPDTLHIDDGCSVSRPEHSRHVAVLGLVALFALGGAHGARRYLRRGR